jgi:small subunit ribosomal protein S17
MDKTVTVEVETRYRHPLYGKVVLENRKFYAHDEENECDLGDTVVIVESRPISRKKRWVVQEIVRSDLSAQMEELDNLELLEEEEEEEGGEEEDDTVAPAEVADEAG